MGRGGRGSTGEGTQSTGKVTQGMGEAEPRERERNSGRGHGVCVWEEGWWGKKGEGAH